MKRALLQGGIENVETTRAPRLEPQSPQIAEPPSPGSCKSSTSTGRSLQAKNTKNVVALDGSKPIRNRGQARKCIKRIIKIIRLDYGEQGCLDAGAVDYFRAFAALEDVAAADDLKYQRSLAKVTRRYLPRLGEAAQAEALAEVRDGSFVVTARWLGDLLGLIDERRDRFKFFDAEAIDLSDEAKAAKLKARAAQLARDRRKRLGATPRSECLARLREQQPDVPISTFYYRAGHNLKA